MVLPEQVLVQVMEAEEVFATGGLKWYWLGTVHSHKKMSRRSVVAVVVRGREEWSKYQKLIFRQEKGSAFCMPCVSDISIMEDGRHRSIVIYSVAYRFPRASPMQTTFVQF
jgi:hypothetical protein